MSSNNQNNQNKSQQASITMNEPQTQQPPKAVEVVAKSEVKMRKVKARRTENRMRFGSDWYQFIKGQETLVPEHMITHLEEKGII